MVAKPVYVDDLRLIPLASKESPETFSVPCWSDVGDFKIEIFWENSNCSQTIEDNQTSFKPG